MKNIPALELSNVCFAYEREEVLHNFNLSIPKKSLVAVVGPNGGGKSTFLRLVLGLLKPQRGTVRVFGGVPERRQRSVGYVAQHFRFDQDFPVSVLDVVLMGRVDRHWFGPYRRVDRKKAIEALERVGLRHLGTRALTQLSGGERQRVLIAQALITEPELLLLDEPTSNVDTVVEREIYDLLHEVNESVTIIVVSHNLNVVTRHASHVACVNRTASLTPIDEFTVSELHSLHRGDMSVLQHGLSCHILDPSRVMNEAHSSTEDPS